MNQEGTGAAAAFEFIWATRGRTWGFRFLRTAGRVDPLKLYEAAFRGDLDSAGNIPKRRCYNRDPVSAIRRDVGMQVAE